MSGNIFSNIGKMWIKSSKPWKKGDWVGRDRRTRRGQLGELSLPVSKHWKNQQAATQLVAIPSRSLPRRRAARPLSLCFESKDWKLCVLCVFAVIHYAPGMVFRETLTVQTAGHLDMHDITGAVAEVVAESGVSIGTVHIFNVGSTAVIGTVEYEPGLERDVPELLDRLIPPSRSYGHEQAWHDGNGHSHLQATLAGPSETIPVEDGRMVLGTWQQIFHLECDIKPRSRQIVVTVQGE